MACVPSESGLHGALALETREAKTKSRTRVTTTVRRIVQSSRGRENSLRAHVRRRERERERVVFVAGGHEIRMHARDKIRASRKTMIAGCGNEVLGGERQERVRRREMTARR